MRRLFEVALLFLLFVPSAHAAEPCASLSADAKADYLAFGENAASAYDRGDFAEAVRFILRARELCSEDPRIMYNLARAYHRASNCHMALFWYEQVIELDPDGPFSAAVKDQRSKAAKYQTELQLECANSARIAIDCTDPGITLRLGEFASERCPYEGRLNAGTYRLLASLEGYESYQVDIELVAGENNRVLIPGLKPVDTRTTGTLKVVCPEAVSSVELLSSDLSESLDCPVERELLPGRYSLRMTDGSEEQFAIAIGETVAINLSRASAVDERIGLLLAIRVAPGMGLSSGPLFQDDNETPFGEELDGLQPTLLTTAIENELGYFITDWLAVLVQTRFEIANLAVLAMAVLRFVPYENEWFSLRLDLGGGGGRILPSVETADGDRPVVRLGPGFGTANLGVGFSLSRLLALVVMVENRVAFPDFGIHFDLGLGLEIRL